MTQEELDLLDCGWEPVKYVDAMEGIAYFRQSEFYVVRTGKTWSTGRFGQSPGRSGEPGQHPLAVFAAWQLSIN